MNFASTCSEHNQILDSCNEYVDKIKTRLDESTALSSTLESKLLKQTQQLKELQDKFELESKKFETLNIVKFKYRDTILILRQGDLTDEPSVAIVNPANSLLKHEGGAAKAIANAAGPEFHNECAKYIEDHEKLDLGEAMTTPAGGSLNSKYVIHTVGPDMRVAPFKNNPGKAQAEVRKCMASIIKQMCEHDITSVSIPAISTGIFRFPVERCAAVLGNTIKVCIDSSSDLDGRQIVMCNIDQQTTDTFKSYFFDQFEETSTVISSECDSD